MDLLSKALLLKSNVYFRIMTSGAGTQQKSLNVIGNGTSLNGGGLHQTKPGPNKNG